MTDSKRYRSILLFGPPGSGKGTQGKILGSIPGFFHLSVGDVFRAIDLNSSQGKEVCKYTSQGHLVPDELTVRIWKKALDAYDAHPEFRPAEDILILDGIPRNVAQTKLVKDHLDILSVIHLCCRDEEDMVRRIKHRAIRENRADDANEAVIRERFNVYHEKSHPVLTQYPADIISEIDANGTPTEVLSNVLKQIIPIQNKHLRN